ncbi:hypothetical protein EON64_12995 [archaeon]|nr:MAG: hypothetical protein EON64_12995 [archaeon]
MSSGPTVWIPSKVHGWVLADFLHDLCDGSVTVKYDEGEKKLPKTDAFRSDVSHFVLLDDLCSMNYLHEAPLLDTLRRRFFKDIIYTSAGDVLISVNPYKAIRGLYENPVSFLDVPEDGDISIGGVKPHVYQVSCIAACQHVPILHSLVYIMSSLLMGVV